MNSTVKLLKEVFFIVWKAVVQLVLIILTIALIPNKNLVSIWLCLLVWILIFKLVQKELEPKDWLITFAFTIGMTALIYLVGFVKGIIGLMLFYAVITGIQLYNNWKLYSAVTLWGAKKVKGIPVEDFNLAKVMESEIDEQHNKRGREEEGNTEEPSIDTQRSSDVQDDVQRMSAQSNDERANGNRDEPVMALPLMQGEVREKPKRIIKKKKKKVVKIKKIIGDVE
jgi:hypothetical protein